MVDEGDELYSKLFCLGGVVVADVVVLLVVLPFAPVLVFFSLSSTPDMIVEMKKRLKDRNTEFCRELREIF